MASPGRLSEKVAIVTGSSSGIGRAIAIRYAREGAKVVCSDLQPNARSNVPSETNMNTHDAIKQENGSAIFTRADVGSAADMENLVQAAVKEYGRLDILVNNAGIAYESKTPARIHLTEEAAWDTTMLVNGKSVFLGCKYAIQQMLKQEPHSSGDRGWIINLSSIYGIVGGREIPSYAASKGAVANLTRQVGVDYAKDGIHVNALCPGHIRTAIYADTTANAITANELDGLYPTGKVGTVDDIAKMAVVLASEDASFMMGACVPVDGGYTAQ